MSGIQETKQTSPWRAVFERVRQACAGRRDDDGVIGSINWLRHQMALLGANPNVVRNIIYRDKGRASDKRVLFEIFNRLWQEAGHAPLQVPELELGLVSGGEGEAAQLLGRETRRAYRSFVSGVRSCEQPKLLVTGRPGSGKTVLTDYIQQALETAPTPLERVVRLEFSHPDLGVSLARLGDALGVPETLFEARLVKIGLSTAFAVQADAQAGVARLLLDGLKRSGGLVLLLHISQSLAGQDSLAGVPLRLHSDEVPRVTAAEWLWLSLLEPASRYKHLSLLVTMAEAPPRVLGSLGAFAGPLKLAPPTASEAKRFVRSKLPHLRAALQDDIARQAGRSYEDLRILTLLAEERDPNPQSGRSEAAGVDTMEGRLELLSSLVETAEDPALRDFLRALAVLSLPEFPNFSSAALKAMGQEGWQGGGALARAFLDAAPGGMGERAEDTLAGAEQWRCFSRRLSRSLRDKLARCDPEGYRSLHLMASRFYEPQAVAQPAGEAAARYLQHLFEARGWQDLQRWLARYNARQILIRQLWHAAERELTARSELESVALHVARYYVRLASYHHPEAEAALALLASSEDAGIRAWTQLKRAEGAMNKGRYDVAETLLEPWPQVADPMLNADYELARASIARWRGELAVAAAHISKAQPLVGRAGSQNPHHDPHHDLVRAKVALWSGLIAKDRGRLEQALRHFGEVESDDGLVRARLAFQKGDVQAKLGRFDTAEAELSRALELARASEAPVTERARYLARRGRVLRKRGEAARARGDFDEALRLLSRGDYPPLSDLELAFERAKVQDERAVNLIALSDSEGAILQLGENLETFTRYARDYRVDASFRILRNRLRLSLAYWARGSSQAYAMPFLNLAGYPANPVSNAANNADTERAQTLVRSVRLHIAKDPRRSERYGPLHTQTLLVASLLAGSGEEAVRCAEEALKDARFSYQEALYGASLAAAKLRAGEAKEALRLSQSAQAAHAQARGGSGERGDLGLLAWLYSLDIRAQLTSPQGFRGAADRLSSCLRTPELAPFSEALLRCFGEGVEPYQRQGLLSAQDWLSHRDLRRSLNLKDVPSGASVRLPDELVTRWRQLRGNLVGALAAD